MLFIQPLNGLFCDNTFLTYLSKRGLDEIL